MAALPHPSNLPVKMSLRRYSRQHTKVLSLHLVMLQQKASKWSLNVPTNSAFAFHRRYRRSYKQFCKLRGKSLHGYVCRHRPPWLTNSSNESVFKHSAAGVNFQILPCLGKPFSRCLKMGWLIIKTRVIQARGTSETSQREGKRLLCFLKATDLTTFCCFWKTEMLHLGWHQGARWGCETVQTLFYWYCTQAKSDFFFFKLLFFNGHILQDTIYGE